MSTVLYYEGAGQGCCEHVYAGADRADTVTIVFYLDNEPKAVATALCSACIALRTSDPNSVSIRMAP